MRRVMYTLIPPPKSTVVRYRIDGVLHQVTTLPRQVHVTVVNRVKVMSRLDIAQKACHRMVEQWS